MRQWIGRAIRWFGWLQDMEIPIHAAHACYFIVLSAFPALVLVLGMLRYTGLEPANLQELVEGVLPEAFHGFVWQLISGTFANTSRAVVSVSALTALWSASRGIFGLLRGLNAVYGVQERRGWFQTRVMCAVYTFLFILVLLLTLVLHVFGSTILEFLRHTEGLARLPWLDIVDLRFFLLLSVQALLFCAMFMYLPGHRNGFRESLPGALLGAVGWMTVSSLFSVYVRYFPRYANIYGSVYTIALAMLWLYVCICIIFYGAVLNRYLKELD